MYSLSYLRRQVDALQRKLEPILTVLRLRNLAMEMCDEYDQAALSEPAPSRSALKRICMDFPHRVGKAGYRLGKGMDLLHYFENCIYTQTWPEPRDVVFTLIPWARRGPILRPDLWERPVAV